MASTPRHHLVPQFLLRRFADDDAKLVMVKRDDLSVSLPTTVNNACNEAGFYRIDTEDVAPSHQDGHDPEAAEKTLAAFEARADKSIRRIIEGATPCYRRHRQGALYQRPHRLRRRYPSCLLARSSHVEVSTSRRNTSLRLATTYPRAVPDARDAFRPGIFNGLRYAAGWAA